VNKLIKVLRVTR